MLIMNKLLLSVLLGGLLFICFAQEKATPDHPALKKSYELADNLFQQAELLALRAGGNEKLYEIADQKYLESLAEFDKLLTKAQGTLTDSLEFWIRIRKGYIEYYFDSFEVSKKDYLVAITLKKKLVSIPDSLLFTPLLFTGGIYYTQNRFDSALYFYKQAEKINEKNKKPLNESQRLYNRLGVMHYETGNYRQAKNYFEKAIAVLESEPAADKSLLANYKINIASLLVKLEEYNQANTLYESLLPSADFSNEINHNLGIINQRTGAFSKAIEYLRKVNYQNNKKTTELYYNFSMAWAALEEADSAELYLHKALAENLKWNGHRKNTTFGLIQKYQGDELKKQQRFREAASQYQQSIIQFCIDFNETDLTKNPVDFTSAFSYTNLFAALSAKADALEQQYRIDKDINLLIASVNAYETAFNLADHVGKTYTSDEARMFLGKIKHTVHSKPIDICLSLYEMTQNRHYLEKAWSFDQQNKASILALNVQEAIWRTGNNANDLFHKEQSLKEDITRLSLKASTNSDTTASAEILTKIRDYEIELENVKEQINSDPKWLEKKLSGEIPSIHQIQKKLDNNSALISYHLSEGELLTLLITGTKFSYYKYPLRQSFFTEIDVIKSALHNVTSDAKYTGTLAAMSLYQVLIEPLHTGLSHINRLIIIPDDELNYLPFEALQNENKQFLTEKFAITYQYTAALFEKKSNSTYARGTLGFAPFNESGLNEPGKTSYSKLPASAEEIKDLKGKNFLSGTATKDSFLRNANRFRTIHLATHASVNNADPMRSFILFHPSDSDNKLYAQEIYNMALDSTQLVILSACETGSGRLVKGEGLMSLSRAFAYAGCQNIITSLWKASDKTTAFLTGRLHFYLEKGLSRDMALQQAKNDLLASNEIEPRYKSPAYWANIILVGNYEPYHKNTNWWWIAIAIIAGAILYKVLKNKSLPETEKA
jgi:CHAT domain-containing protein